MTLLSRESDDRPHLVCSPARGVPGSVAATSPSCNTFLTYVSHTQRCATSAHRHGIFAAGTNCTTDFLPRNLSRFEHATDFSPFAVVRRNA